MRRAPRFWQRDDTGMLPALLRPAALVYDLALRARFAMARPDQTSMPVICVGNLTVGGAGKTPTAIALARLLQTMGRKPGFLSRGYGGSARGPLLVDPKHHTAAWTGDEPQLLATVAPTIVSANRPVGARLAEGLAIDVLIMDDGLQNPGLAKSFSLAVVDAGFGVGNGRVFPAGPLRGTIDYQLGLIDALLVVGDGVAAREVIDAAAARAKPVLHARLALQNADDLASSRVIAFAGIGRPEKFFDSLRERGAKLIAAHAFADHHAYRPRDAAKLLAAANAAEARLVTTEKDAARLAAADGPIALLRARTRPVAVRLEFTLPEQVAELLRNALI